MTEEYAGSPELWIVTRPRDRGPEGNVKVWEDAEQILDGIIPMYEAEQGPGGVEYEGVTCALVDAYNRCIEERRRAEDLLKLRRVWESRYVGGVVEPESAVRTPEK